MFKKKQAFKKKQELLNQYPVSSGYDHRNSTVFALPVNRTQTQQNRGQNSSVTNQWNNRSNNVQSRQTYNATNEWNSGTSNEWNSGNVGNNSFANEWDEWNEWNRNTSSNYYRANEWPEPGGGFTERRFLNSYELNEGYKPWARTDMFMNKKPYRGPYGMRILRKYGWKPGQGLGRNRKGVLEPPPFIFKVDKRGLLTAADLQDTKSSSTTGSGAEDKPAGKHPVMLLLELCIKNKWNAPQFITCLEEGPVHNKNYLIMVRVNGVDYRPKVPRQNKKVARAEAAILCLKALGENNWSM